MIISHNIEITNSSIILLQIVQQLLGYKGIATTIINKSGETVLDTAQKMGQSVIAAILEEQGIQSAKSMRPNHNGKPRAKTNCQ